MTKKDYILIAKAIQNARAEIRAKEPEEMQPELLDGIDYAIDFLVEAFTLESLRFEPARFLAACEYNA